MLGPTELAAIDELQRRWLACELEGRPSDVLHLCSPDVVWLPPEQWPLRGTAAIRAWLATAHDRVEQVRLTNVTVDGDGGVAYKTADFCTRYVPNGSTEAVTVRGWHVWVLRRDANSAWRVVAVAWSLVDA